MQHNLLSDQKFRGILYQTLVVGLFAIGIYFVVTNTAYNLEKRNIATGFGFLNNAAGGSFCANKKNRPSLSGSFACKVKHIVKLRQGFF